MTRTQTEPYRVPHNGGERRVWTKAGPVDALLLNDDDVELQIEARETSTGEPASLALFGFAVGTFIVAFPVAGVMSTTAFIATLPSVLIFAGVAQFIGGLIAFRRGNAFAGTAFGAYGANNAVVATFFLLQHLKVIPTTPGSEGMQVLGLELLCFGFISLVLAACAARLNLSFVLTLLALVAGFTLAGLADLSATISPTVGHVGGYFLMAAAAFAAYAASALVINSTWERNVLPLGSLG
jgi:hypothetical protein